MFELHSTALDCLLAPGDYRSRGLLRLTDTPGTPKIVPERSATTTPSARSITRFTQHDATGPRGVDALQFDHADTCHWLAQGLTIDYPQDICRITQGAHHITVDFCLVQHAEVHSFRVREARHCTIQRCVIRETAVDGRPPASDSVGIAVGNIGKDVLGIQILGNEIYIFGDALWGIVDLNWLTGQGVDVDRPRTITVTMDRTRNRLRSDTHPAFNGTPTAQRLLSPSRSQTPDRDGALAGLRADDPLRRARVQGGTCREDRWPRQGGEKNVRLELVEQSLKSA